MKIIKLSSALLAMLLLTACPGSKDDDSDSEFPPKEGEVASVNLVYPENGSECTTGVEFNETQSLVVFQWEAAENIDSYEVNLIDLNTNASDKFEVAENELGIALNYNTPYKWFVISKREGSDKAPKSEEWQFYNAGAGVENYAPFPADVVSPPPGTVLTGNTVTLEWTGSDVDNDIVDYEILLDSESPPQQSLGTTAQTGLNLTIDTAGTYYWQVLTKDSAGNTSRSEVFGFGVQ